MRCHGTIKVVVRRLIIASQLSRVKIQKMKLAKAESKFNFMNELERDFYEWSELFCRQF